MLSNKSEYHQIEFASNISQEIIDSRVSFGFILTETTTRYNVYSLINLGKLKFCLEILSTLCVRYDTLKTRTRQIFDAFSLRMRKIVELSKDVTETI